MVGLCEGGNEPPGSLKASDNAGEMSLGSSTESYPAFARIGLRENPGKNLNQVTCPDRDSNPGHLVSQPDALTVTPQNSGRPHSLKWVKGIRSNIKCTVVQQKERDRAYLPAATVHHSAVSYPRVRDASLSVLCADDPWFRRMVQDWG
ncbi:hypothetical protein ANN_19632 [Periplaneta americana]|uniref:Uncharacterized protein n=1 Tax=Periplaneta americana TaxID=6978 RepID=A0ABQ8SAF3_PERAM|nr:hypothetical protein ANN_19632 [Periplaneta americana]